ncbi:CorA family divalent cation transporter [Brachybacterium sp. GPGPB12]|uniref:CorA family divalent cation transporter n=1 Tax=Brachybacterium sp. GPGPB12 TaxID=3023517 RepID=UPI003134285E
MQVVDSVEGLEALGDAPGCAFARDLQDPVVEAAVRSWDIQGPRTDELARRPFAHLTGGRIELVLLLPDYGAQHLAVRIHAAAAGVLVMGAPEALEAVRAEATAADGVREAVVGMLAGRRAPRRGGAGRVRGRERAVRGPRRRLRRRGAPAPAGQEAVGSLPHPGGPGRDAPAVPPRGATLPGAPEGAAPPARRAAVEFKANSSAAARLHTVLGDLLAEQGAVVNERLTLVATIFMPLTLATGFFGMNFAWMQERTGSAAAFVLLGIVLPTLATVITLVVVRRLTGSR